MRINKINFKGTFNIDLNNLERDKIQKLARLHEAVMKNNGLATVDIPRHRVIFKIDDKKDNIIINFLNRHLISYWQTK